MTPLLITGRDAAADRATLQALVDFQQSAALAGLPLRSRAECAAGLAALRARAVAAAAQPFADRYLAAFEHGFTQLLDAVLAQPLVALHPQFGAAMAGPITLDIALLLRQQPLDDDVELDLAVRWWQLARAAGLPVDADFGECFRLIEWAGLLRQLLQPAAGEPGLAAAVKVALRYAPLKPLVLLLEPLSGAPTQAGYTF